MPLYEYISQTFYLSAQHIQHLISQHLQKNNMHFQKLYYALSGSQDSYSCNIKNNFFIRHDDTSTVKSICSYVRTGIFLICISIFTLKQHFSEEHLEHFDTLRAAQSSNCFTFQLFFSKDGFIPTLSCSFHLNVLKMMVKGSAGKQRL